MSFFDSFPSRPEPRLVGRRPDGVFPGSAAVELLLVHTENVAIAVGSIRVYPDGFDFTLRVRLRAVDRTGRGLPAGPMRMPSDDYRDPDQALRLGVQYSDGRRAAVIDWGRSIGDSRAGALVLMHGSGAGGPGKWDGDLCASPLPPDGPVTVVVSWPEHGITQTAGELDGTAIRAAAGRAVELWPDPPPGGRATSAV